MFACGAFRGIKEIAFHRGKMSRRRIRNCSIDVCLPFPAGFTDGRCLPRPFPRAAQLTRPANCLKLNFRFITSARDSPTAIAKFACESVLNLYLVIKVRNFIRMYDSIGL